ncbi:MAG: LysR family transcriptional regulator [Myxococcota bacterium]
MFNWNDIRYFLALYRHESLAGAGGAVSADPTTVSRRLIKLEEQLGARLFSRTPNGYQLTDAGQRLLPKAEGIEREVLAVERGVAGEDQRLSGVVRIAATEMMTTRFIAPHLGSFREKYPGIRLEFHCTNQEVSLARRDADIALRMTRPTQDDLLIKRIGAVRFGLYASHEYLARHPDPGVSLDGHQLILFADRQPFHQENAWLQARAPRTEIALRLDSVSAIYAATAAGAGLSLLPRLIADRDPRLVRMPMEGGPEPHQVWQAVHKDVRQCARINAVIDFLGQILDGRPEPVTASAAERAAVAA